VGDKSADAAAKKDKEVVKKEVVSTVQTIK
jgi:hypothetical protein